MTCEQEVREREKKTKNASQSRERRTKLRAGPCRFRAPGASEEAQALGIPKGAPSETQVTAECRSQNQQNRAQI